MNIAERIAALDQLGQRLLAGDEYLDAVIHRTDYNNKWFSKAFQNRAVQAIASEFLSKEKLEQWVADYSFSEKGKNIAIILNGNIPLSNFHDVLSVFVAGHRAKIKLHEKDQFLLPCLLKFLIEIDERTEDYFEVVQQLTDFQGVIISCDQKMVKAYDSYFGKYPNIIRGQRNSVAVLNGEETDADLLKLGDDIFQYFGWSSRNVSKVYLPKGYEIKKLLEVLHEFKELVLNNKYKNNFDYNFSLCSLNRIPFHINGCMILIEETSIRSRISSLHYEHYDDIETLEKSLQKHSNEIENIVAAPEVLKSKSIPFGETHTPALSDYGNGVDTLRFLEGV